MIFQGSKMCMGLYFGFFLICTVGESRNKKMPGLESVGGVGSEICKSGGSNFQWLQNSNVTIQNDKKHLCMNECWKAIGKQLFWVTFAMRDNHYPLFPFIQHCCTTNHFWKSRWPLSTILIQGVPEVARHVIFFLFVFSPYNNLFAFLCF